MEQWRDIPGYEGSYQVSDQGRVRSLDRFVKSGLNGGRPRRVKGRVRVATPSRDGYLQVQIQGKTRNVHQLVLLAFAGPRPDGFEVAHFDGDTKNNRRSNLRYATSRENADDRIRHGTNVRGVRQHKAKLTPALVKKIRAARGKVRQVDLAEALGVSQSTISTVQRCTSWSYLK